MQNDLRIIYNTLYIGYIHVTVMSYLSTISHTAYYGITVAKTFLKPFQDLSRTQYSIFFKKYLDCNAMKVNAWEGFGTVVFWFQDRH